MKRRSRLLGSLPVMLMSLGIGPPLDAQRAVTVAVTLPAALSGEEVVDRMVRRNLERAQALRRFQGTRIYRLDYHGFPGNRSAQMVVDVKFDSPASVEFTIRSATGSNLLIERVFKKLMQSEKEALLPESHRRLALNKENYSFTLDGQETTPGGSFYILAVEPRTRNKMLYRGRIWVDTEDFAVARVEAAPAENPSFWIKDTQIEHRYEKVADFWLPAANRSTTNTRLGGTALLTIEYMDYRVTAISEADNATDAVATRP